MSTMEKMKQDSGEMDEVLEAADETEAGASAPQEVQDTMEETVEETADVIIEESLQQDMENLIIENIVTPAADCCNY